jgi:hypothetical protein
LGVLTTDPFITALDAHHCPSAVLFLFNGPFGAVLHIEDATSAATTEYISRWLVVATGENAEPVVLEFEGAQDFAGTDSHVSEYKCGKASSASLPASWRLSLAAEHQHGAGVNQPRRALQPAPRRRLLHCLQQAPPRLLLHASGSVVAGLSSHQELGVDSGARDLSASALRNAAGSVRLALAGVELVPEAHRGKEGVQRREHGTGQEEAF